MIDHTNCDHPRDRAGRAACRKAKGGTPATRSSRAPQAPAKGGPASLAAACEQGAYDASTLDDRIRDAKRRPPASPVKVTRI